jgi:hypothetical protein
MIHVMATPAGAVEIPVTPRVSERACRGLVQRAAEYGAGAAGYVSTISSGTRENRHRFKRSVVLVIRTGHDPSEPEGGYGMAAIY